MSTLVRLLARAREVVTVATRGFTPLEAETERSLTLETMQLPNDRFLLIISDAHHTESVTTPQMLEALQEKSGAAAVLVFDQPVMVYVGGGR